MAEAKTQTDDDESETSNIPTAIAVIPPSEPATLAETPLRAALLQCYSAVRNYRDTTGRRICELFVQPPNRKEYPDYYQLIKNAMSLAQIKAKILNGRYLRLDDMARDFTLMVKNAQMYNVESSQVYEDANILAEIFEETLLEIICPPRPPVTEKNNQIVIENNDVKPLLDVPDSQLCGGSCKRKYPDTFPHTHHPKIDHVQSALTAQNDPMLIGLPLVLNQIPTVAKPNKDEDDEDDEDGEDEEEEDEDSKEKKLREERQAISLNSLHRTYNSFGFFWGRQESDFQSLKKILGCSGKE